jgi:predicted porin
MKRSTLALAVSGLFAVPGLALAQSTVQVYGNVRALFIPKIETGISGAPDRTKVDNPGGSRIGFKGTENLGGGNRAWFQIEQNIGPDTNAATNVFGSRNTAVGLQGNWGNFLMGNWDSPYKEVIVANQPFGATTPYGQVIMVGNGDTTGAAVAGALATGGTAAVAFERRLNNTIQYHTPSFSGFSAKFGYQAPEAEVAGRKPELWSVNGQYRGGPFYVGVGYEKHKDFILANREDSGLYLAGRYRSGPWEIGVGWERLEYEPTATQDLERDSWHIDGQYRFGPHRIGLSYIKADDSEGSYSAASGAVMPVGAIGPAGDTGATQWTVHYGYALSKRTEITAAYARLSNDSLGVYSNRETAYGTAGLRNQDMNVFAIGLWHSF